MKIHYITSNKGKFEEALSYFAASKIELVRSPLELDEIQASALDVARHKIIQGFNELQAPCLVDDVSLFCGALGGLPGPYIRAFLEQLGDAGLAELISHYADRSCRVVCHIAYAKSHQEQQIFEGMTEGRIVFPRGLRKPSPHNWNAIFQPDGSDKTFAEMSLEEIAPFSARAKALNRLKNYLLT